MNRERTLLSIFGVLTILFLSACVPSQAEMDATATQAAAVLFATQTAAAPTSTTLPPTDTPVPTDTLEPTPEPTATPPAPLPLDDCISQIAFFTDLDDNAMREAILQDIFQTFPIFAEVPFAEDPQDFFLKFFDSFYPSLSPDGQQIAFTAGIYSGGDSFINYGIFIVEAGGTEVRRLVPDRAAVELLLQSYAEEYGWTEERTNEILEFLGIAPWAFNPVWSPDGQKIAFIFGFGDSEGDIYVINADGSGLVPLGGGRVRYNGAWSPNSQQIVFTTAPHYNDIYKVNADGSELTRLTNEQAYYESALWSPDGQQIVFVASPKYASGINDNADIFVMNLDGSGLINLTNDLDSGARDPSWSPDGQQILFNSIQDRTLQYYAVNADGSDLTTITHDPAAAATPIGPQCPDP